MHSWKTLLSQNDKKGTNKLESFKTILLAGNVNENYDYSFVSIRKEGNGTIRNKILYKLDATLSL